MSRYFSSSVAAVALAAMLAGPVMAQTATEDHAPEAAQTEGAPVTLPQVLRDAGVTDAKGNPSRHGMRVQGKLPDGTQIGALLDDKGELRGVRAMGDAAIPASLVERLIPQAVRSQAIFAETGQIDAIFLGGRGVMVSGHDAQQKTVRAVFAEDGTLLRFGRGEERRMRGDDGKHGDHGDRGPGKHGPRDHDKRGKDHDRRGGPDGAKGPAPTPDQVRAALTDACYTEIGQILQQGPVTVAQATNPEGEPVLVELGARGKVLRELNR